jgi:very-short-patch-repair endonuclease
MSVIPFEKSFASHEKSKYWSEKNGYIKSHQITKGTDKKYWFTCLDCHHDFEKDIYSVVKGQWCGYCTGRYICGKPECYPCKIKSFEQCEKSNCWSEKNGEIKPINIMLKSNKTFWFNCDVCYHDFESIICNIAKGHWCPYCSGHKICGNEICCMCIPKSFASHIKSKNWDYNKNTKKPFELHIKSNNKYWFICSNCSHSYDQTLNDVNDKDNCRYCCNPKKDLCNDDNCKICFTNSFASQEKSNFWSDKNVGIKPRNILLGVHGKYWFDCPNCKHPFQQYISVIRRGSFCNFCSGKVICKQDDCVQCYNNSFASHEKSRFWNYSKNTDKPIDNFICCKQKRWFIFDKNPINSFQIYLYSIVAGAWCPYCVNKTESKLYEKIQPFYPTMLTQFKQEWCKKISYLPFDFVIPEYKIIIELDGPQHFQQISNWSSPEEQFENDKYKETCANDNGYSVIRLLQEDVFYDTYDWVKELCETIEEIKIGDEIANVYLCKNGEYDAF